ncbi:MAG: Hpt domain-containing protein, partial [Pseudobdellovibrionaceae bacterium]|nr:Hpt domain-containing protein [Pseudobdellovibrionaceae bacterium]
MRSFLTILLLFFLVREDAWAITEIKLVQGAATLPGDSQVLFKIVGEAEMVWDALLTPQEFEQRKNEVVLVPFPAVWSGLEHLGVQRKGKATYRLSLHIPEALMGVPLGMWLPRTLGPATIWLNDRMMIHHDFGPDGSEPWDRNPGHNRIYFTPQDAQQQIIIQTTNRHVHTGGFLDRFLIGRAEEIQSISLTLMAFDFLVFGLLVFSSVYHLWLFTFRRKFVAYRDLGLFFMLVVIRLLCTGSSHWLSELGWNEMLIYKIGWVSFYSIILVGVQMLRSIYPVDTPAIFVKVVRAICLTAVCIVVVSPLSTSQLLLAPMQIFTILLVAPVLWILFLAYHNRRPGTLVLLPATALLMIMAVVEIYNAVNRIDQNYSLLGLGVLLFSLGASVSQSLNFDRTFHMVERQTRGIDNLNRKLRKQAEFLERRIHQTTEEMATLLHNLPEGVLLIEENEGRLRIGSYLSQSTKHILGGAEVITWPVMKHFLEQTNLDSDQRAQLEATLQAILGDDAISFELNAENLPQELRKAHDQGTQTFLCAWAPVILDRSIHSVLLVLVDVSSERSIYHQFELEQQIFDRMVQLLAADPDNLMIFMHEAQHIMKRLSSQHNETDQRQARLLRELHTLKGLARSFGLTSLARTAHDMEDRLLRQPTSGLESLFTVWKSHRQTLNTLGFTTQHLPARERDEDLLLVCGQQLLARPESPSELWLQEWHGYVQSLFIRTDALIHSLQDGMASVAAQLGKPTPLITIEGGEIGIRRTIHGKLLGGLNHILRNALDHGLESPDERRAQNKPEQGSILV